MASKTKKSTKKKTKKDTSNKYIKALIIAVVILLGIAIVVLTVSSLAKERPKEIKYSDWTEVYDVSSSFKDSKVLRSSKDYKENILDYSQIEELDFDNNDYLLVSMEVDLCSESINGLRNVEVSGNKLSIEVGYDSFCGICAPQVHYYLIPFNKDSIKDNMNVEFDYVVEGHEDCDPNVAYKPIIYLYPEEDTKVKIKLGKEEKLTVSYPKYEKKWEVLAKKNGDLVDLESGRTYYGLYWEGENSSAKGIRETGFVIRGEDSDKFLEEKLAILGLNEREANEFIVYWLPKLESNKYNYIYFETMEEINKNMPLKVSPKPDTVIRVLMEFKGLDRPIEVEKQKLESVTRDGFTLVEWGGTELK